MAPPILLEFALFLEYDSKNGKNDFTRTCPK